MGWNVRLFLLLIPYAFWSESSYLSYGVKELGFLFCLSGSRVTNPWTYKIVGFKPQSSSYYFCMLTVDLETLILCFWVVMPPFLWMSQIFSEHLQPLCCPSHSRFLNSLMHLQNPFPLVSMLLYASSITLIVELRYSIALTLCWSYYYDPRCLRGSSSSLAMIYVPVWWLWPSLSKASRDAI